MEKGSPASESREQIASALYQALLSSDRIAIERLLTRALNVMTPLACADELIAPALQRVGDEWSEGRVALAQVYLSGRYCEEQLNRILRDVGELRADAPRLGIAVLSDHHVLGKRIVASCLRSAGYRLKDYGAGVSPEILAAKVREDDLEAVLISTLMLPSAMKVRRVTSLLEDHPAKVFVGGAPFLFDPTLWEAVGADAMGRNAADGLQLVRDLERRA